MVDAVGRTLRGDTPKWLRYTGKGDYYTQGGGSGAVVVEDCISAAVVARRVHGVTGFAILGTQLTKMHRDALAKYDRVFVALDPDAYGKTLSYTQQLKGCDINATAIPLKDDLKYCVDVDIGCLAMLVASDTKHMTGVTNLP
jgi:hypothetical protein